jgi:hypothetical protein
VSLNVPACRQVFKLVPTMPEMDGGITHIDVPLAMATVRSVLRTLCALHAAGIAHGEVNDISVLCGMRAQRHVASEAWRLREHISVVLAPPVPRAALGARRITLSDIAALRPDLPIFYAPERFDERWALRLEAAPPGDVWAIGVLLLLLLRHSLPLRDLMPMVRACQPPARLPSPSLSSLRKYSCRTFCARWFC